MPRVTPLTSEDVPSFVDTELCEELSVETVVIPAGDKPSVVADAPEDYAKDTSPDKVSASAPLPFSRSYFFNVPSHDPLQSWLGTLSRGVLRQNARLRCENYLRKVPVYWCVYCIIQRGIVLFLWHRPP